MKLRSLIALGCPLNSGVSPMAAVVVTLTLASFGNAGAQVRKEDNTDTLDLATSWVGGVAAPTATDIAQWDDKLTVANTADLGTASSSWLGIKVLNPTGAPTITGTSPVNLTL